ncbi:MAG: hypothetical protein HC929_13195 [Leptolyngbyaceae cyanobacterium SM2_5_2]|nr:hypothetical protein [Leptolyngbyaceae cyanobacterium SM2_5_2]
MAEKKPVSFRFPEPLITQLKARAEEEGVTVTELISRFSQQGLDGSVQERLAVLEQKVSTSPLPALPNVVDVMGTNMVGASARASLAQRVEQRDLDSFLSHDDWYQQFMQLKQQHEQLIHQFKQVKAGFT